MCECLCVYVYANDLTVNACFSTNLFCVSKNNYYLKGKRKRCSYFDVGASADPCLKVCTRYSGIANVNATKYHDYLPSSGDLELSRYIYE